MSQSTEVRGRQGVHLLLKPDLTILDASEEYRSSTLIWREPIGGCDVFTVFPDNPSDAAADGVKNLRSSFEEVLRSREPHLMAVQRYDVRDRVAGAGAWVKKFWAVTNSPVFGSGSREITHLIHEVRDVPRAVEIRRWVEDQRIALRERCDTLLRMQRDVQRRQAEIEAVAQRLMSLLDAREERSLVVEDIARRVGVPPARGPYLAAGERVAVSGIYDVYHLRGCRLSPTRIFVRGRRPLPDCGSCHSAVLYRIFQPLA